MADVGAPKGNSNATKGKPWRDAIDRALAKREKSRIDGKLALDELAEKLLTLCDEGDLAALKEMADRIEGKAAQSMDLTVTDLSHEDALKALERGDN